MDIENSQGKRGRPLSNSKKCTVVTLVMVLLLALYASYELFAVQTGQSGASPAIVDMTTESSSAITADVATESSSATTADLATESSSAITADVATESSPAIAVDMASEISPEIESKDEPVMKTESLPVFAPTTSTKAAKESDSISKVKKSPKIPKLPGTPTTMTTASVPLSSDPIVPTTATVAKTDATAATTTTRRNLLSADAAEGEKLLHAITWNIAAINNNPFEYWITSDDPSYNYMMSNASKFMTNPGALDMKVKDIIHDDVIDELMTEMKDAGWEGVKATRKMWENDYKNRNIITGFMQDDVIGLKRLTSMPDRVTNTINT
jgi:hypothetical protein